MLAILALAILMAAGIAYLLVNPFFHSSRGSLGPRGMKLEQGSSVPVDQRGSIEARSMSKTGMLSTTG
jgi:hypothetical protein